MTDVVGRLRQPEYTGENRCYPCTVVNFAIGFALALVTLLGLLAIDAQALALPLSMAVLALAAVTIYLRGYLVPGTPELTKRYFPPWLLALFGKDEAIAGLGTADASTDGVDVVDPERTLVDAGALEPCEEVDDLCLTADFEAAWRRSIAETRTDGTDRDRLVAILDAGDLDPTFDEQGEAFWARTAAGHRIGKWESRAAFVADVAAAPLLADRVDVWDDLSVRARGRLLNGLRLFLTVCPDCEAELRMATETVESCCSTHDVAALSCESCGARLFESEPL